MDGPEGNEENRTTLQGFDNGTSQRSHTSPGWLLDLENRLQSRKQKKLGHEIGAGARCFSCREKCPGLELHYWRKKCKNCKCSKEEHDVAEDDDLRFHILFTGNQNSSKYEAVKSVLEVKVKDKLHRNAVLKQFADSINAVKPMKFDWVPPQASPLLAADYMNELPSNRMPISGSAGAKYRKIQLKKQIPMHDILPERRDEFTSEEQDEFLKFLEKLRENAGIGEILRVKQVQQIEQSTPCHIQSAQLSQMIDGATSSEIPFEQSRKTMNPDDFLKDVTLGFKNINILPPSFNTSPVGFQPFKAARPQPKYLQASPHTSMRSLPYVIPTSVLRVPSAFKPRMNFENNLTESNINDVSFDTYKGSFDNSNKEKLVADNEETADSIDITGVSPLPLSPSSGLGSGTIENGRTSHVHTPAESVDVPVPILAPSKSAKKMSYAKCIHNKNDDTPSTSEENNDSCSLCHSLVASDQENANSCDDNACSLPDIKAEIHQAANLLDCVECKGVIEFNSIAVFIKQGGPNAAWHPKCFVCQECKELLVDLVYFYQKGYLYCARHFTEKLKIHRCFSCDELIFVKEYTLAEGQYYHLQHFCCIECDMELGGNEYVLNDLNGNHPTCLKCFEKLYAKKCITCCEPVKPGQEGVSFKKLNWHATPDCFKCSNKGCNKSLIGHKFLVLNSQPFCSRECSSITNAKSDVMQA